MIRALSLNNFKTFRDQRIPFGTLTLLTGLNGLGKSSVIQALLLLRQSYRADVLRSGLELNGDLIRLGTGRDILFEGAEEDWLAFQLEDDEGNSATWRFDYDRETDVLALTNPNKRGHSIGQDLIGSSSLFNDDFAYLQAERVGPRIAYGMSESAVRQHRQLGTAGEFTAHFLSIFGAEQIGHQAMAHPSLGESDLSLAAQAQAWLGEVSPGTRINIDAFRDIDQVRLSFAFDRGRLATSNYRATNVGFGISYTLPVLVALLSARPGSLILLENPEAHLHPRGQARIGELIARAANGGVQVLVETHSDHLLNGLRIAARQGLVEPEQVMLHFFQRPEEESLNASVQLISPRLDKDGRIDFWPENFFDEWDRSLDELL